MGFRALGLESLEPYKPALMENRQRNPYGNPWTRTIKLGIPGLLGSIAVDDEALGGFVLRVRLLCQGFLEERSTQGLRVWRFWASCIVFICRGTIRGCHDRLLTPLQYGRPLNAEHRLG